MVAQATTSPVALPPLVWPNGQRMRPETLTREIAAPSTMGVRSIMSGHPAQGLTPVKLARLLRTAEDGDAVAYFELAEEMEEKDLHYLSVMGTRKRQVSQLPIEVIAAGNDEEAKADAQFIRDWLDRDMLQPEIFDMLDAVGKGVSAIEIIWQFTSTEWTPVKLKWRDPRFFEFDRVTGETLMLRDLDGLQALPFGKFIVHYHPAKSGLPIRSGIARAAAWSYMFKNYAIKDWVAFLENYGMPIRVGKYDNGETETNINVLLDALASLGSDAAAAFPKTMEVEFIDAKAGTAPNDLWRSKAEYCDSQLSKVVLGQTGTTDSKSGGIGDGGNKVHDNVRGDIERSDAVLVAATLNEQLIPPMVMLNRGVRRRYPRLRIGRPDPVDVKGMVEAATGLVALGAQVDADEVRDRAGLPAPKPGGRILVAMPKAAQEPTGAQNRPGIPGNAPPTFSGLLKPSERGIASGVGHAVADAAPAAIADNVDDAAAMALGDWEQLIDPVLDPVRDIVAKASSLDDIKTRLIDAIERMDVSELTERLARAGFGARLAGDIDARGQS
ncbi:DUF935 domain-containing protein [Sphingomonas paucimobilis]|uniref:DUF935 domain-containing protein n=1 Tax=Sphingomonas paucimobilis TaxID=13689 RepID=A0A7T3E5Q5_SPHPI|nr:DUF935 domain-containing protein [Sphingomonas paucimobilis]QPT08594.1 DUF935 domain-containing protein [Sphingomonas paucimobilis]